MNSLSWLIFIIGFFENIGGILSFAIFIAGLVFLVSLLIYAVIKTMDIISQNDGPKKPIAGIDAYIAALSKTMKFSFIAWLIIALISAAAIDRKYMIYIAASEVGELIVQSETVQSAANELKGLSGDATDLLKTYIAVETKKLKEELIPEAKENTKN